MKKDIELYSKLISLPEDLKKEAGEFVEFLKSRIEQEDTPKNRKAGLAKGLIEMTEDFDEPLEDFEQYRK